VSPLPEGVEPETARALLAATQAIQQAGGVFLTTDQAAQLAKAAAIAAEPWLRAMTLRLAGAAMRSSTDEIVRAMGKSLESQATEFLKEIDHG